MQIQIAPHNTSFASLMKCFELYVTKLYVTNLISNFITKKLGITNILKYIIKYFEVSKASY